MKENIDQQAPATVIFAIKKTSVSTPVRGGA